MVGLKRGLAWKEKECGSRFCACFQSSFKAQKEPKHDLFKAFETCC